MSIDVKTLSDRDSSLWDEYVKNNPNSNFYHLYSWKHIIENALGRNTIYLAAIENKSITGVFPLVQQKNIILGNHFISLPYFNYGGICAQNNETRYALLKEAIRIAQEYKVTHIEIRECSPALNLPVKTSKVSMVLQLEDNMDKIWNKFKSKLRSQIRKALKEDLNVIWGSSELLNDFYTVYSIRMKELGTPVFSKGFFECILKTFPNESRICNVLLKGKAVASAMTMSYRNCMEVPWAASSRDHDHMSVNMSLYWNLISRASETGCHSFDFGRSTPDSGTFRFKEQWGCKPVQHYWYYWQKKPGDLPQLNPQNPRFKLAISVWRQLPVSIANMIGPIISRNLP